MAAKQTIKETKQQLADRIAELQDRLNVAEDTLRAIREGDVDAVIVAGSRGEQVFSLTESADLYRLMVETMNEAGLAVTPDGTILFANNYLAKMLQVPLEKVVGRPALKFVHPDSSPALHALITSAQEASQDCRLTLVAADGTAVPVHAWGHRLDRPDGPTICIVGVDLTQLEASREMILHLEEQREALRRSEARFRALFENSMDAMFLTTPEGGIIDTNASACVMFGVAREVFQRRGLSAIPGADANQLAQLLAERARAGLSRKELTFTHTDGTKLYGDVSSVVVKDAQGNTRSFVAIRDITKQRLSEEALAASVAKLKEANRDLSEFANVVAHDLKAPLRAVAGLADIIAADHQDSLGTEGRAKIEMMKSRIRRMHRLIEDILEYSRLGRIEATKIRTDLRTIVDNVVESIAPPVPIKVVVEGNFPTVPCDPVRMHQVFQNLIGNAIKHMERPEGEIHIGCMPDDGSWRCHVRDNGVGIDQKHFERIFKIFQTLKPKDETESTGIGLSIVRRIVEGHGGRVWVESRIGEGSTFYFTIPEEQVTRT